jgi:hypothetical protein
MHTQEHTHRRTIDRMNYRQEATKHSRSAIQSPCAYHPYASPKKKKQKLTKKNKARSPEEQATDPLAAVLSAQDHVLLQGRPHQIASRSSALASRCFGRSFCVLLRGQILASRLVLAGAVIGVPLLHLGDALVCRASVYAPARKVDAEDRVLITAPSLLRFRRTLTFTRNQRLVTNRNLVTN